MINRVNKFFVPRLSEYKNVGLYSGSGSIIPCKFEDYLKIEFHDWMNFEYCFVLCFRPIRMLLPLGGE